MAKNKKIVVSTPKGTVYTYKTKNGKVTSKLEWNPGFGASMTSNLRTAQAKVDITVMRLMEPYMQMLSGAMISSMRVSTDIGSGEIVVNTPYAAKVYYSNAPIGRQTGSLRGPKYFERMKADKKEQILRVAKSTARAK